MKPLSQLPDGERIFLDANIFKYSAFDHPTFGRACRDFLARIDQEEIHGYCSEFVLNEVFHKYTPVDVRRLQKDQ